jgi:hypothetical protein
LSILRGAFTYQDLVDASSCIAAVLLADRADLHEEHVAFQVTPGFLWVCGTPSGEGHSLVASSFVIAGPDWALRLLPINGFETTVSETTILTVRRRKKIDEASERS